MNATDLSPVDRAILAKTAPVARREDDGGSKDDSVSSVRMVDVYRMMNSQSPWPIQCESFDFEEVDGGSNETYLRMVSVRKNLSIVRYTAHIVPELSIS